MDRFRFLHAADIHLDSPLRGLNQYDDFPIDHVRGATRRALDRLVEIAIAQRVAFVVLAGDLYDGRWQDATTGLYMVKALSRLTQAGIRVFTLSGNHDAASIIARDLPMPPGIDHFPSAQPTTFTVPELRVALHGQSFGSRQVLHDLTPKYPAAVPGWLNIGVLHTSLSGYGEHETYAPCTVESLTERGYDYWALGHVHTRQIVCEAPWIVFPGVLQGRHARETGACGAMLVEVEGQTITSVTPVECDSVRWMQRVVDATGLDAMEDLELAIRRDFENAISEAPGHTLVIRLTITGNTSLHGALCASSELRTDVRAIAVSLQRDAQHIALEKLKINTAPPVRSLDDTQTQELDEALDDILSDPEFMKKIDTELASFMSALPPNLQIPDLMTDENTWPVQQASAALRARLVGGID